MPEPVEDLITVRITEEADAKPKKKNHESGQTWCRRQGRQVRRRRPASDPWPSAVQVVDERRAQKVGSLESMAWPNGFNEYDVGSIKEFGKEGTLYYINYDNTYHIKYRRSARGGDIGRDVVTEKYILCMRIMLMGYEHALRTLRAARNGDADKLAEFLDEFRRMAARGAASTVLALAENLPKIVDKSAVTEAQDVE
jgi:hypothetical protein